MKNFMKNMFSRVSILSAIFLLASCTVGLGPAVDLDPPEIKINSHKDNDSVASTFILYGTASDNDEVTAITIDFDDADIHYQIVPGGLWQKKILGQNWITINNDNNNYCVKADGKWRWSISVDTADKKPEKTGNNYNLVAVAEDKARNSGKNSKTECSLIVDTQSPKVSIYKPDLYSGDYETIKASTDSFVLKDNNVVSRLVNGEITLMGRQSDALSFKALRIQFDSGKLGSSVARYTSGAGVNSIQDIDKLPQAALGDEGDHPVVYYSKTLTSSDLREWSLTVKPEDWMNANPSLKTGKHIIRIVTTSLSSSNAWEKRIAGYFVWWPEADIPWITIAAGTENEEIENAYECYPGSDFSGNAYDDDGIKSVTTQLYKRVKQSDDSFKYEPYGSPENHEIPSGSPRYCAWSVKVPSENAFYKIVVSVNDYTSESPVEEVRYFKSSDVSAPVIKVTGPLDNTSALLNAEGNIPFNVTASDNSKVARFEMVWLNPAMRTTPDNKIKFLTGEADEWNSATPEGYTDSNGNKIYLLGSNKTECVLNKTFNLYSDFGIDGVDKTLVAQEFIFRAVDDSGSKTVKAITLTGDSETPVVEFKKISINGNEQSFENDNIPSFPNSCNQKTATITGTWSDKFTSTLNNTSKVNQLEVEWGKAKELVTVNPNGTWSVNIVSPNAGGTITVKLKDFGGNAKTVQAAASIETADLSLARIDCSNDDGDYTLGKEINIILEFTKSAGVDFQTTRPTLSLNNGGTAVYESDSGSTSHIYKYTVGSSDLDVEKLNVTAINANGAQWYDSSVPTSKFTLSEPPAGFNLADTRTITIDKKAPEIKSVTALTSAGYYKAGVSVLLMMEFTEDVTITNSENLSVKFKHKKNGENVTAASPSVTGSRYVLFTHDIQEGENADPLQFQAINGPNVTVKDNAGNVLVNWVPKSNPSFAGLVVDTTKPAAPGFGGWNPDKVIFGEGTEFELSTSEIDIESQEYSLDGGTNWVTYTGKVSVVNNGTYNVVARQTDHAGNVSSSTSGIAFAIDKGDLLTRVSSDTANGSYSTKTDTKSIKGRLVFRKDVSLPQGTSVVLNVKNGGTYKKCPLNECSSSSGSGKEFTFDYTIADGDTIEATDKLLDVTGLVQSDGSTPVKKVRVTDYSADVDFSFPTSGSKSFKENRQIKIMTGKPSIQSVSVSDGILRIVFDRNISKGKGSVVIEYSDTSLTGTAQNFYVPAVLTSEEYNELKSNLIISNSYIIGTNGAEKSGNYLTSDISTKYILKTDVAQNNGDLVNVFKSAGKHRVTVPVISDQVYVTSQGRASDGNILAIDLTSTYALPVKGAVYKVTVPAGLVSDEVKNSNDENNTNKITSEGIEAPEIRIVKPTYSITIPNNATTIEATTKNSTVDITPMQTATMYLSCRTPGATLKYGLNSSASNAITVHSNPINVSTTKTAEITVPSTIGTNYNSAVSLGAGNVVNSYSAATGLKIAIAAVATKNGVQSEPSYEYAARTVVKFNLQHYRDSDSTEGTGKNDSRLTNLWFKDLRVWICGGDSPYGPNSTETCPLAWSDPSKFKMMAGTKTYPNAAYNAKEAIYGTYYWVTWDVTSTTYIGFVAGNVPSDANTNGPSAWFVGDYHWTLIKDKYPLYPGETLIMSAHGEEIANPSAEYFIPYGAKFAFNAAKYFTR